MRRPLGLIRIIASALAAAATAGPLARMVKLHLEVYEIAARGEIPK